MRYSLLPSGVAGIAALLLAACSSGGGSSPSPPPPATNTPPTANAGSNQTVNGGALVTLNGTASTDPDGTISSYAWTQTAGTPAVTLSSSTASQPTFTAPAVTTATTFSFSLTVTDNGGANSTASSVSVTVNPLANTPPTANAGSNQTVSGGALVTLNGTASTDPDGTISSYAWTQTAGSPAITLSSSTASQPTFTAPAVAAATTFSFSLTVTDNGGATSAPSSVSVTVNPPGNVSGRVRFTRIPVSAGGLDYAAGVLSASRGVLVRAINAGTQAVLATTSTDANGDFTMSVTANTNVRIVVVAQMLRDASQPLPRWNFSSADKDATTTPYTYTDGISFNSNTGTGRNIDIPSGFDAAGNVTGTRASAPFAILDTVYQGFQLVLGVAPTTNFPELLLDWATNNPGSQTFFDSDAAGAQTIVLSADVTEDTDEFDQHVIAHEFGHYIEYNFSRADNIGGSHGLGDKLDIRVAFGEGFGYAFGAIVLNDPVARDTYVSGVQFSGCLPFLNAQFKCSSTFNLETNPATAPPGTPSGNFGCWCSESSVWSILWDIYDNNADTNDTLALGFQPLWTVLINEQRTTRAFTSLFSFISALKTARPANEDAAIDTLLTAQNIDIVTDAFGSGETHAPTPVAAAAAVPVYTSITVGGPAVVLRNVNDAGHYNKLGNRRFLRFTLSSARTTTISVSSSNTANADPDFLVYRNGALVQFSFNPPPQPEVLTLNNAAAGDYLIDVYDCANGCDTEEGTPGDYDITVTVN